MKIRGAPNAAALAALLIATPVAAAHVTVIARAWHIGLERVRWQQGRSSGGTERSR
jgi:hypothetical protein